MSVSDHERTSRMINWIYGRAVAEDTRLTEWDIGFAKDLKARLDDFGERLILSHSQHEQLSRINAKV